MKKLLFLCTAMFAMLVSCSKDYENKIVGTWNCEQETIKKTKDGVTTESTRTREDGNEIRTMIFREDKTCSDYTMTGMVNNNEEPIVMEHSWRYSFDDDYLVLTDDYMSMEYRIESINSSKLVLVYKQNAVIGYESPEPLDWDVMETIYTMKKQ